MSDGGCGYVRGCGGTRKAARDVWTGVGARSKGTLVALTNEVRGKRCEASGLPGWNQTKNVYVHRHIYTYPALRSHFGCCMAMFYSCACHGRFLVIVRCSWEGVATHLPSDMLQMSTEFPWLRERPHLPTSRGGCLGTTTQRVACVTKHASVLPQYRG